MRPQPKLGPRTLFRIRLTNQGRNKIRPPPDIRLDHPFHKQRLRRFPHDFHQTGFHDLCLQTAQHSVRCNRRPRQLSRTLRRIRSGVNPQLGGIARRPDMHDFAGDQPQPHTVQEVHPAHRSITCLGTKELLSPRTAPPQRVGRGIRSRLTTVRATKSKDRVRIDEIDLFNLGIGRLEQLHDPPADRARHRSQQVRLPIPRWKSIQPLAQGHATAERGIESTEQRQKGVSRGKGRQLTTTGDADGRRGEESAIGFPADLA